jgi:hypothetical protein
MKKCTKCGEWLDEHKFDKNKCFKDGLQSWCRKCRRQYDVDNKEKIKVRRHDNYLNNRDEILKHQREYYSKSKPIRDANKSKRNNKRRIRHKIKYDSNPEYRISMLLRRRFHELVEHRWASEHTLIILGCSVFNFLIHLQKTADDRYGVGVFDINNYNGHEWHMDHIVPAKAFNLNCSFHRKLCFRWDNYQILKSEFNIRKHNKISKEYGNLF